MNEQSGEDDLFIVAAGGVVVCTGLLKRSSLPKQNFCGRGVGQTYLFGMYDLLK